MSNYPDKIQLHNDKFSNLGKYGSDLDGIVLDLGLSSMQIDEASRGFSFMKDGPLDMRMSKSGPSAADLVNTSSESEIANILYFFGEERSSDALQMLSLQGEQRGHSFRRWIYPM